MAINLNDTLPAAPAGGKNIKWQEDISGNVSGYFIGVPIKTTITSAAGVLTLDASLGNSFLINVLEAITSMSITNPTNGQEITLLWVQDGTGHAVVQATNLKGATAVTTTANKISCQKYTYDLTQTNWYAIAAGSVNM